MLNKYLKPYAYLMLICSIYPWTGADGVIYKFEGFTADELGDAMVMTSTKRGTRPADSYFEHLEKGETTALLNTYLPGDGTTWATFVESAKSAGLPITFTFRAQVQVGKTRYESEIRATAVQIAEKYQNCNVMPEKTMANSEFRIKAGRDKDGKLVELDSDFILYSPTEEECKAEK